MAHDGVNGNARPRCASRRVAAWRVAAWRVAAWRVAAWRVAACLTMLATAACIPFKRVASSIGLPDVHGYLGRADRAPAQGESVDTAPAQLWRTRLGRAGSLGAPAMGERVTVLATPDRWLYAIDTRTGKVIWRRRSDATFGAGPLVAEGLVLSASEGPFGRVMGSRISDGRRRWSATVGDVSAPLAYAAGSVYGVTTTGVAFSARVADGKVRWRREIGPSRAAPVVVGSRVALVTITDTLATLDTATGAIVGRAMLPTSTTAPPTLLDDSTLVIADPSGAVLAVAVPSGRVLWRVATESPVLGPAVLARDTVFALTTACTLWRVPVRAPAAADSVGIPDCVTEAAPTVLRDGVLVASVRGEVILFDPRTRRRVFTRAVRGQLQQPPSVLHGQVLVAPALGEVVSFR